LKQLFDYNLDLIKLDGVGDFTCPCCGVLISPNDEAENVYSVLEAKVRGKVLENLKISCNTCGSKILLTGFTLLG
jgi:predicted RNA-binding Zn-ribbon protein involved in translation (DUF1610 family)